MAETIELCVCIHIRTIVRDVGGFIPKEVLWSEYQMYCKTNDFTPVSKVAFKSEIERNGGSEEQRQVNKVRVRGFTGIRRVTDPPSESEIALRKKQDTTKATMLIFDEEDEQDK